MQARAMLDEITSDLDINDTNEIKKPKKRFGKSIFNMMLSIAFLMYLLFISLHIS